MCQWGILHRWTLHLPARVMADAAVVHVIWIDMAPSQIVLYGVILLVLLLFARRWFSLKGLKSYSPTEVAERLKRAGSPLLLDVRTSAERQRNSIRGSLHIPLHELGRRSNELEKHKNREIICYCASGNRSISAAARLKKIGFTVANMTGGIAEWNSLGLR
jgi:rhodanese-related sulfurtransferase